MILVLWFYCMWKRTQAFHRQLNGFLYIWKRDKKNNEKEAGDPKLTYEQKSETGDDKWCEVIGFHEVYLPDPEKVLLSHQNF